MTVCSIGSQELNTHCNVRIKPLVTDFPILFPWGVFYTLPCHVDLPLFYGTSVALEEPLIAVFSFSLLLIPS